MQEPKGPTDEDYARLLAFRTQLRRFEHWSRDEAAKLALTQAQHQLLLAIRGHDDPRGPTIGQVADHLLVRHHTAGELADRTHEQSLVSRHADEIDHRVVRLRLTTEGSSRLRSLSALHLEELRRLSSTLGDLTGGLP